MLDFVKDRVCILVPGENFGVVIMVAQKVFNGGNEIGHAFEHSASKPALRQFSKPPLDHIQPRGTGRGKGGQNACCMICCFTSHDHTHCRMLSGLVGA